jgi:hypothetical protein
VADKVPEETDTKILAAKLDCRMQIVWEVLEEETCSTQNLLGIPNVLLGLAVFPVLFFLSGLLFFMSCSGTIMRN